jgi:hypothetical protein
MRRRQVSVLADAISMTFLAKDYSSEDLTA